MNDCASGYAYAKSVLVKYLLRIRRGPTGGTSNNGRWHDLVLGKIIGET